MQKSKIANAMSTIANLLNEVSDQFTILSVEMGGDDFAPVVKTIAAVAEVAVPNVPATPEVAAIITPVTVSPTVTSTPMVSAAVEPSTVEIDDEGLPWDERIHAKTKTKVKSNLVKGGTAWRGKKGADPALAEQLRNEWRAANPVAAVPTVAAVPAVPVVPVVAAVPAVPVVPVVPVVAAVPAVPAVPVVPVVDEHAAIRKQAIDIIGKITADFGVPYDEVFALLQKEFNVTDYSNLVPDQYPSVVDTVQGMYDDYTDVSEICKTIFKIGGAEQAAAIQAGLTTLGAADLGAITYENLPAINTAVAGYHQQYLDAGFGQ